MGLPELSIAFKEIIRKPMPEVSTGKVLMILKDESIKGKYKYYTVEEVKEEYSTENLKYIKDCFIGNRQDVRINGAFEEKRYAPESVTVVAYGAEEQIENVLKNLETEEFDFLVSPTAEAEDNKKMLEYLKKAQKNYKSFAIITTNTPSNNENVLEFEIGSFTDNSVEYTDAKLLPRIAGLCAGTPLGQSITYATLGEISSVPSKTEAELNGLIDRGKITLINKGGKVRIARGVTSLTTTDNGKGKSFTRIEQVRIYKYIDNVISSVINNVYVGKVKNSYTNKIVLITEIKSFLKELSKRDLVEPDYTVEINIPKQREYLKSINVNVATMTEDDIRTADTDVHVFIKIAMKPIGSMEDFNIEVEV